MIDSHCHLDLDAFETDWQQVVSASQAQGVNRFLIPGTTPAGWVKQVSMANSCPLLDIAFGLHPYFLSTQSVSNLSQLEQALNQSHANLVAVGEIGIDTSLSTPISKQQAILETQLQLASQFDLPVILHHRKSHHLLIQSIKRCGFQRGGVVHAFSGSEAAAQAYIELGFNISVGGTITYPRAQKTRNTVARLPLNRLLLETDAPDMPLKGRQGARNSPLYLPDVCRALANIKGVEYAEIEQATTANYYALFGR